WACRPRCSAWAPRPSGRWARRRCRRDPSQVPPDIRPAAGLQHRDETEPLQRRFDLALGAGQPLRQLRVAHPVRVELPESGLELGELLRAELALLSLGFVLDAAAAHATLRSPRQA